MKEKLYKQVNTKENPLIAGWYNTDKGELFWYKNETVWSCRDDKVSEEYPNLWYKEVKQGKLIDADKLKDTLKALELLSDTCKSNHPFEINGYNNGVLDSISVVKSFLNVIDELSEERDEYKFTSEDIVSFVEWTNLHYRALEHTKSIKNVKDTNELIELWAKEQQPNPLKIAIKGEDKPTGLIPALEERVEKLEKQSDRWCYKFQAQKINYREAIEKIEELETENAALCKELEGVMNDRDDLAKKFIEFKDRENVILEASIKEVENRKKVLISKILDFNNQCKNSVSTIQDFKNGVHIACTQIIDLVEKM